ncbi:MAG: hypothetical protein ING60_16105 [Rhodocyclaceae bacterium]|nr:hypothetical protein [Rhodocyclaceae bacterium]MCA3061333.1 hypothetical protein [Rhodocyclaceae bacterium]
MPAVAAKEPSTLMRTLIAQPSNPRNEGYALYVRQTDFKQSTGDAESKIFGLDFSEAPVPARRYAAEVASLEFEGFDWRFIFGQKSLDGEGLESALVLRMNPTAGLQFVNVLSDMNGPSLDVVVTAIGITPEKLATFKTRPHQMANVVANFAAVAVSGYETCIDFYQASAFAMQKLAKNSKALEVEPVVRIDIRTSLFAALADKMKQIAAEMPSDSKNEG